MLKDFEDGIRISKIFSFLFTVNESNSWQVVKKGQNNFCNTGPNDISRDKHGQEIYSDM